MVSFKGKISEPIQKELGIKKNTVNGVKGIILSTFLIAPSMFLWLVVISIIKGKDAIINFDLTPFLAGAIALTVVAVISAVTSFKKLLYPANKLPPFDNYEHECSIDENGIKSKSSFSTLEIPFKKIRSAYKGDGYFIIYGRKAKNPIVLEESLVIEGNYEDVEQLLLKKISKKKHTNKEKLEKTNTYSIIGIVFSVILVAITIPLIMLILYAFVAVIVFTMENILLPISSWLLKILFPFDEILLNILFGIIALPLFLVCCFFIWAPVILFEAGVFFLIYPSILCCSLIFPLKQLTVNKNKLTKFAIIFAICMIFASIGELILYATVIG